MRVGGQLFISPDRVRDYRYRFILPFIIRPCLSVYVWVDVTSMVRVCACQAKGVCMPGTLCVDAKQVVCGREVEVLCSVGGIYWFLVSIK